MEHREYPRVWEGVVSPVGLHRHRTQCPGRLYSAEGGRKKLAVSSIPSQAVANAAVPWLGDSGTRSLGAAAGPGNSLDSRVHDAAKKTRSVRYDSCIPTPSCPGT